MIRKNMWSGAFAAAALVTLVACGDAAPEPEPTTDAAPAPQQQIGANVDLPEGVTLAMVQEGKQLFETTVCHACHGPDGAGTALAPNLRDQEWLNSDGSFEGIEGVIRNGVMQPVRYPGMMPAQGGGNFTDDQIRALTAYVYVISHGG